MSFGFRKRDESCSTTSSFLTFYAIQKAVSLGASNGFNETYFTELSPFPPLNQLWRVQCPLGVLTPPMQRALLAAAEHSDSAIILTPWRGVIATPVPADRASNVAASLQEAGLVLDPASPWSPDQRLHRLPGCTRSRGDTRSQAAELVRRLSAPDASDDGSPYHIAGCERACGAPHTPHTLVLLGSST